MSNILVCTKSGQVSYLGLTVWFNLNLMSSFLLLATPSEQTWLVSELGLSYMFGNSVI